MEGAHIKPHTHFVNPSIIDNDNAVSPSKEVKREMQGNIRLYHVDHLGSTSLVTDIDGEITQHVAYIPYGEVFVEQRNGSWSTPYLFNAKELDEETGLYYYGVRYLNPKDTRWLSVDPILMGCILIMRQVWMLKCQ